VFLNNRYNKKKEIFLTLIYINIYLFYKYNFAYFLSLFNMTKVGLNIIFDLFNIFFFSIKNLWLILANFIILAKNY